VLIESKPVNPQRFRDRQPGALTRNDVDIKLGQPMPLMKSTNARSGAGTRRRPG
jgi:hypothetical protein